MCHAQNNFKNVAVGKHNITVIRGKGSLVTLELLQQLRQFGTCAESIATTGDDMRSVAIQLT